MGSRSLCLCEVDKVRAMNNKSGVGTREWFDMNIEL